MLKPETVTLPNGQSFHLHAAADGRPGYARRVDNEGMISAQSNKLKAGIEYGSVMGVGAITGRISGRTGGRAGWNHRRRGRGHDAPAGEPSAGASG